MLTYADTKHFTLIYAYTKLHIHTHVHTHKCVIKTQHTHHAQGLGEDIQTCLIGP
jgi:hypothetical protein